MSLQVPDISQPSPEDMGVIEPKKEIKKKSFWDKTKGPIAEILTLIGIAGAGSVAIKKGLDRVDMIDSRYQTTTNEKNNLNQSIENAIGNNEAKVTLPAKSGDRIAPEQICTLDVTKDFSIINGKFDIGIQDSDGWHSLGQVDYNSVGDRPEVAYGVISGYSEHLSLKNIGEHDLEVFYDDDRTNYFPSITEMRSGIYSLENLHKNLVIHHVNLKDNIIIMESWEKTQTGDEVRPKYPCLYYGNFRVSHDPNTKDVEYTVAGKNQNLVHFPDVNYISNIKADGPGFLIQASTTFGPDVNKEQTTQDFLVNKVAPSIPNSTLISK